MDPQTRLTQSYQKIVKSFKSFAMIGQLITLLIRILSQRIFSVYIGIVLVQFIVTSQMYFKTYCVAESRFYIIMNFILVYLLAINFIENLTNQSQDIQTVLKDSYIIDYTRIGYPLEFLFRMVSSFLMWRLYQFSKLKALEYGDLLPNQEAETSEPRRDMIHVRENAPSEGFGWGPGSSRYDNENSRNLPLEDSYSQSVSNHTNILRQRSSRVHHEDSNINNGANLRGSPYVSFRQSGASSNFHQVNHPIHQVHQMGAERFSPASQVRPVNYVNHNQNQIQIPYTSVAHQYLPQQQVQFQNLPIRR